MTLSLTQSVTAVNKGCVASFLGVGGTAPFTYTVLPGGAGGTIGASTGIYTAPNVYPTTPATQFDTVRVTDALAATATATIAVGPPLFLFCNIIQTYMGLANGRVYLWDQKIFQPKDSDIYVIVDVVSCKPFANVNNTVSAGSGMNQEQFVSMQASLSVNIISRGTAARDRKEEVILALESQYARQQQDAGGFYIGKLSTSFVNLSTVDGAAIPYRYKIMVNMQYAYTKTSAVDYFDTFTDEIVVDD